MPTLEDGASAIDLHKWEKTESQKSEKTRLGLGLALLLPAQPEPSVGEDEGHTKATRIWGQQVTTDGGIGRQTHVVVERTEETKVER